MIKLSYNFKCDVPGCSIESNEHIGDVNHRMSIPEIPIPRGWHYLDHRIVCTAHNVVIDAKTIAPVASIGAKVEFHEPFSDKDYSGLSPKGNLTVLTRRKKK